jgi:hypothetical protein
MEEHLSKKVNAKKVNKGKDFKMWLVEVKRIDEGMKSEHKEFKWIMLKLRDAGCHFNSLYRPSHYANSASDTVSTLSASSVTDHTHALALSWQPTQLPL